MFNNLMLMGDGTWDCCNLLDLSQPIDNQNIPVRSIFVNLSIIDGYGINTEDSDGGTLEGFCDIVAEPIFDDSGMDVTPLETSTNRVPIFPGRFVLSSSQGGVQRELVIELNNPELEFLATRVWLDGIEITNEIHRVLINVNAMVEPNGEMQAWVMLCTGEVFGIPNYETVVFF